MLNFILSLHEFGISVFTIMLLGLLTAIYRLNKHLAQYAATTSKARKITDKINKLGKYLVMGGGLMTLPMIIIFILSFNPESKLFINMVVAGYLALAVAIPVLIMAFLMRVLLSDLSMSTVLIAVFNSIKSSFKNVKAKLRPHWRIIAVSVSVVTLLLVLWPVLQLLLYLGAFVLLARIGVFGGGDVSEVYEYDSGGTHFNYVTGKMGYSYQPGACIEDYEE